MASFSRMIPLAVILSALAMFGPPLTKKPAQNPCSADTVYVVVFRHLDFGQPIPVVVDDSTRVYEVKP